MATDIGHTIVEFENLMQSLIVSMLGWDLTIPSKVNDVRISWITGGAPAFSITDNKVFIRCYEEDHPYNKLREEELEDVISPPEFNMATGYTRIMRADFVLYGTESFENAQRIRDRIFYPDYKLTLAKEDVYLIPEIVSPKRLFEQYEGRWWERTDMSLRFNELIVKNVTVQKIDSMEVTILSGEDGSVIEEVNIP